MSIEQELQKLISFPSYDLRKQISEKISDYYVNNVFNEQESLLATEVLRMLAHDSEMQIRKILSEKLKVSQNLPHDIAFSLANDLEEVALPMLEFSKVLTETDLIEIVRGTEKLASLVAIARRDQVSAPVGLHLINKQIQQVAIELINNKTAIINEESMDLIVNNFKNTGHIMEALIGRGGMPVNIAERIVCMVSDKMRDKLIKDYKIDQKLVKNLMKETQESSIITNIKPTNDQQILELVEHLYDNSKLTDTIILKALCKGELKFFAASLGKMSKISIQQAYEIVFKESVSNFAVLYKEAKMPKGTFSGVNIILQFALQETDRGKFIPEGFSDKLSKHIIDNNYHQQFPIINDLLILMKS